MDTAKRNSPPSNQSVGRGNMTQCSDIIDRRQACTADAKRLRGKWAKAHFPDRGLGAALAPNKKSGDWHFGKNAVTRHCLPVISERFNNQNDYCPKTPFD